LLSEYVIIKLFYEKATVSVEFETELTDDDDLSKFSNIRQNRFKEIANAFTPAGNPTIRSSNVIKSSCRKRKRVEPHRLDSRSVVKLPEILAASGRYIFPEFLDSTRARFWFGG
jgi:hypothetical protein